MNSSTRGGYKLFKKGKLFFPHCCDILVPPAFRSLHHSSTFSLSPAVRRVGLASSAAAQTVLSSRHLRDRHQQLQQGDLRGRLFVLLKSFKMPPKKAAGGPSKKTEAKKKEKIIEVRNSTCCQIKEDVELYFN